MESYIIGSFMSGFFQSVPMSQNFYLQSTHPCYSCLFSKTTRDHLKPSSFHYNLLYSDRLFYLLRMFVLNCSLTLLYQLRERTGGKERKRRMNGWRMNACFVFCCTFIVGYIDWLTHKRWEKKCFGYIYEWINEWINVCMHDWKNISRLTVLWSIAIVISLSVNLAMSLSSLKSLTLCP